MKLPRRPGRRTPAAADEVPLLPDTAPDWNAIDAALAPHYGHEPARHVAFTPPAAFSTNLHGCSAFAAGEHWFYVTFGLSERGLELTMRVPRAEGTTPPDWPYAMLNELGKQVRGKGVTIAPGDRVDLRAPVTGHPQTDGPPSALTVLAFRADPVLDAIGTPQGTVQFVQVVGVTAAEKAAMLSSSTDAVLLQLAWADPLLVLDPARNAP